MEKELRTKCEVSSYGLCTPSINCEISENLAFASLRQGL